MNEDFGGGPDGIVVIGRADLALVLGLVRLPDVADPEVEGSGGVGSGDFIAGKTHQAPIKT